MSRPKSTNAEVELEIGKLLALRLQTGQWELTFQQVADLLGISIWLVSRVAKDLGVRQQRRAPRRKLPSEQIEAGASRSSVYRAILRDILTLDVCRLAIDAWGGKDPQDMEEAIADIAGLRERIMDALKFRDDREPTMSPAAAHYLGGLVEGGQGHE